MAELLCLMAQCVILAAVASLLPDTTSDSGSGSDSAVDSDRQPGWLHLTLAYTSSYTSPGIHLTLHPTPAYTSPYTPHWPTPVASRDHHTETVVQEQSHEAHHGGWACVITQQCCAPETSRATLAAVMAKGSGEFTLS
eukprot:1153314-Pelagomonas_calceolata.AAC.2